jgi:hypothetical protein
MPFGPASSWTYGNGVTDTRTFDLDYRMTGVKDVGTGNIQYLSFGYDAGNNVTGITDHVTPADNQTFTYDRNSHIKFASGPYGSVSGITYDSSGNRTAYGATSYTYQLASNRLKKAGGSAITFISTGNISAIAAAPFTYYKTNQLSTAKPSTATSTFWYDAFGNRLKVKLATAGNPFRVEIYDLNGHLLTQTSGSTIIETDYAYLDGMPLYVVAPGAATFSALHTDNIGTVQRATNSSKTIVWTGNYDPNGAVTPTTSIIMNARQLGVLSDVSGDNHNGFRDLVPGTIPGYLQSDPAGIYPWLINPSGPPNTYPWLASNPYNDVDPLGLWQLTIVVARDGGALRVTTGINHGQSNVGYQVGLGTGWSIAFDPNDSEPVAPHTETGVIGEGKVGRGVGVDLSDYISNFNSELLFSVGAPGMKHTAFSLGLKNGQFEQPTVSFTWGDSTFFGIGPTIYQPIVGPTIYQPTVGADPCKVLGSTE